MAIPRSRRATIFLLLRLALAAALLSWSLLRFRNHYTCMLPWNGYGAGSFEFAVFMFVVTSLAFFIGFVWIVAEVLALPLSRLRPRPPEAWLVALLVGVVCYSALAGWASLTYPDYDASTHRVPLSLVWVAGYFDRTDHYGAHCGQ